MRILLQLIRTVARVTFQEIINYIQANLNETITLDELATLASLSPRHFSRKFKLHTQMSPNQYVIRCRVETAELLLLHTDIPIADIAILVGFHSQSHLNRHFKRILKVTPQTLKQNKQETPKKKKVVHKDSWKRLTNYIWIFFPKSVFEDRINIKNKSSNSHFVKHDFDSYQQIQENIKDNNLNFVSDIITTLMLHYFIYFVCQHYFKDQKFNFSKLGFNDCTKIETIKPIKNNQLNPNSSISTQENIKYVQNVEDKLLGIFLGYEHSNISATLFNFKENITMKINPVSRVKNQSIVNLEKSIENDELSFRPIKEQFQGQISDGGFSPDLIKERLQDKIPNGEVSRLHILEEGLLDKISDGEFSPDLIKERLQDQISNGELRSSIKDEFQKERNLGKFVDSFTGEGLSKTFDSFTGVDLETPFDSFSPGEFFSKVGLPYSQLTQLDIYSLKDDSNFDLMEFGNFELPSSGYGIVSELELPNNMDLGNFNFREQLPFLNNFLLDEVPNLVDAE